MSKNQYNGDEMDNMKDRTAIVGVGHTVQGKVPGRSSMSFHLEAARNAIADTGLKIEDVDGLLMQPPMAAMGDPMVAPAYLSQQLGIRVRFMAAHDAWGASAGCLAQHAAWAVASGMANYVLCTYGENALSGASEYGRASHRGGSRGSRQRREIRRDAAACSSRHGRRRAGLRRR